MQLFPIIFTVLCLGQNAHSLMITLDCERFPESCNNDCYGIFGPPKLPSKLHWDVPNKDEIKRRRKGSGCIMSNSISACSNSKGVPPYNKDGETCDEYPYASTTQGGMPGAVLRCLSRGDNGAEGGYLQKNLYEKAKADGGCENDPCDFNVMFDISSLSKSPLCITGVKDKKEPKNDGHEFKLKSGGGYDAAKRDETGIDMYTSYLSANGTTFPMHLRREFLMSNGMRVMLGSTDLNQVIPADTIVATDGEATFVVCELFGQEKTPALRPPIHDFSTA